MKFKYTGLLIVVAGLAISSCKKQQTVFENPYLGGKAPLGIVSDPQQIAVPESGIAGTVVSINATGLLEHKDELKFLFNGQQAEIVEVTATGIKVKVPAKASTGVTAFVVNGQLVFGPTFTVIGKVNVDPTFVNTTGANGAVFRAFPIPTTPNLLLLGSFNNYDNKGIIKQIGRIARVFADGSWDRSLLSGVGANNTLTSIAQVGAYYYIGGDFSGYAQQGSISRLTRINTSGTIDTMQVITYLKKTRFVPAFNGGVTGGSIREVYAPPASPTKMIVTGSFTYYVSRQYDFPTYKYLDSTVTDSIEMRQLARINDDGTLDKTWRFDPTAPGYKNMPGKSLPGANGPIMTYMHSDGKILVYGQFTKFDDKAAGNITRLTPEGAIDPTFNVGTGADDNIVSVSYNATLNKYLCVGRFKNFNGKAIANMIMLNYDGSVDATFVPKVFEGGELYYCKLLSDGLALVNGAFKTYDGVIRNGFLFVNQTGALADGYNTIGGLNGIILDTYETRSADNKRALLIMGSFSSFDNKPKNNIVRVTLE